MDGKLGHRELLDRIIEEGPRYYRPVDLKYLGGFAVAYSFCDG